MTRHVSGIRPAYSLVHEARHTIFMLPDQSDAPDHVTCTYGRNKGLRVCDQTLGREHLLRYGGGNSHEFLFLVYLRDHPNALPKWKREAQVHLQYLADHMFNKHEKGILRYYGLEF